MAIIQTNTLSSLTQLLNPFLSFFLNSLFGWVFFFFFSTSLPWSKDTWASTKLIVLSQRPTWSSPSLSSHNHRSWCVCVCVDFQGTYLAFGLFPFFFFRLGVPLQLFIVLPHLCLWIPLPHLKTHTHPHTQIKPKQVQRRWSRLTFHHTLFDVYLSIIKRKSPFTFLSLSLSYTHLLFMSTKSNQRIWFDLFWFDENQ